MSAYGPPRLPTAVVQRAEQAALDSGAEAWVGAAVAAAGYDPALGLDRSVCLRDVIEALQEEYRESGIDALRATADALIEQFLRVRS